ncbi:hypothetical protein DXG01_012674 [Tephrocybe rancida]|nr:hypothetical protein DXG01_012674 [Tephrocybe rancida]
MPAPPPSRFLGLPSSQTGIEGRVTAEIVIGQVILSTPNSPPRVLDREPPSDDVDEDLDVSALSSLLSKLHYEITDHTDLIEVLLSAANNGVVRVVEQALDNGAPINARDTDESRSGQTPLHYASRGGHEKVVQLLLGRRGVDVNAMAAGFTPLYLASDYGHTKVVQLLVSCAGIDINATSTAGVQNWTALHIAASNGHEEVVHLLLSHPSIIVDPRNTRNNTPLYVASLNNRSEVVAQLLHHRGISLNLRNSNENTALHIAASKGHIATLRVLVSDERSQVNTRNINKLSPLYVASWRGMTEAVKCLLGHWNIKINFTNGDRKWTALHAASSLGHRNVARLLAEDRNVNLNLMTLDGETALTSARNEGHTEIVQMLRSKGGCE